MAVENIHIPHDLLNLKPSDRLESVSMSKLARSGTRVLRQLVTSAQAVTVTVQGHDSMVTLSQRQYDELVALIRQLRNEQAVDDFTECLGERFDQLVASMVQTDAARETAAALFTDPELLNRSYHPGTTETES